MSENGNGKLVHGMDIPIVKLVPRNGRSVSAKYVKRIEASLRAVGLLEPLIVFPQGDNYEILDGCLRYRILLEMGVETVPCLIGHQREAFTGNRMVNQLSPAQEMRMLRKSLEELAGKGAGAAEYSQKNYATVTNVDIGGGRANSATFRSGNLIGAAAMNYGGRILEIEKSTGRVRHIAGPAKHILNDIGLRLEIGDSPSLEDLRRFTDRMADMTVELIEGTSSPLAQMIYLTPPVGASGKGSVLMFSGGIGHYYYQPISINSVSDATIHDDVGPLLAESLRRHATLNTYTIVPPSETLRATVLGASTQTVTLSGSTIWAEREILPLKNVPVTRPSLPASLEPASISRSITDAVSRWDVNLGTDPFAVALELDRSLDYESLTQLASGLKNFADTMPSDRPLIAIIERDYAQALGQTVKGLAPSRALLVIGIRSAYRKAFTSILARRSWTDVSCR